MSIGLAVAVVLAFVNASRLLVLSLSHLHWLATVISCRRLRRTGSALAAGISWVDTPTACGRNKWPILLPSSIIGALSDQNLFEVLGKRSELDKYWSQRRVELHGCSVLLAQQAQPTPHQGHGAYAGWVDRGTTVPLIMHGDEGKGRRGNKVLVISFMSDVAQQHKFPICVWHLLLTQYYNI